MLSSGWSEREGERQLDTHGSKDQLTQTHWHVWLQSLSLSVPRLFRPSSVICLDHCSVSVKQTPHTHMVLCVTVELSSCVCLSGVELKPDMKHTTKQWSHENRMKLPWGSNHEPPHTHTDTQAHIQMETRFKGMTPQAPAVSFIDIEWSGLHMEKSRGCRLSDRQAETAPTPCPLLSRCTPCFWGDRWLCFLLFSFLLSLRSLFFIPAWTWACLLPSPAS